MTSNGSHNLQSRVDSIYDHLYANAPIRTPAGISAEVGKILHCGIYLEAPKGKHPAFDVSREEARALIAQEPFSCHEVSTKIRRAFKEMNGAWRLYEPSSEIALDDLNIGYMVAQLSGINLNDSGKDVFGDVIEIIRSTWAKRVGGQFFTDQRVTALAMELLGFDPRKGDDLVDICAGTGGFLLAGLNRIRHLLEEEANGRPLEEEVIKLSRGSIKGLEVDDQIAGLANASLKARLGTRGDDFVSPCDSLSPSTFSSNMVGIKFGAHLCAASNPPFGTKITVKERGSASV